MVLICIPYTYQVFLITPALAHMHLVIAADPEPEIMFPIQTHTAVLCHCEILKIDNFEGFLSDSHEQLLLMWAGQFVCGLTDGQLDVFLFEGEVGDAPVGQGDDRDLVLLETWDYQVGALLLVSQKEQLVEAPVAVGVPVIWEGTQFFLEQEKLFELKDSYYPLFIA